MDQPQYELRDFLRPLFIDDATVEVLAGKFHENFKELAAESHDQFLPTPISESILRPVGEHGRSCHLAIDIGGTNLRVGFVELLGNDPVTSPSPSINPGHKPNGHLDEPPAKLRRRLEKSWPISNHLKNDNADSLFLWIGKCIAKVVQDGCSQLNISRQNPLPLGVTFSFPMVQDSLAEATLMSMGKGFAISSNMDLGKRLQEGYAKVQDHDLPPLQVTAIANDSVSTLVSFIYSFDESQGRRASMGLILGTGCNATIPLKLSQLHPDKQPANIAITPGEEANDVRIAVNTELSIKGTAPPLRDLGVITSWDEVVDSQNETPGFQPLEYMTAGRYLGELGRIIFLDYLKTVHKVSNSSLPEKLLQKHGLTTTFLSHFRPVNDPDWLPEDSATMLAKVEAEFPARTGYSWTEDMAACFYYIARAIESRAARIIAAAVVALLELSEDLPPSALADDTDPRELGVGYTGGCIVHFQNYLVDCQDVLDRLIQKRYSGRPPVRVLLSPCHDGGITGAGILAAAASSSSKKDGRL